MKEEEKQRRTAQLNSATKKARFYNRLRREIVQACKLLGLTYSPALGKLYIRARNRGYHNGYQTCARRVRMEG